MRIVFVLILAAWGAAQPATLVRRLPGRPAAIRWRDMDGDGRLDLVYAAVGPAGREIGWYRGTLRGGLEPEPAHRIAVLPDVVLWGLGDVDPAPGLEVLFFTPRSVFAYRPTVAREAGRYRRLFREELFFARAATDALPFWPEVRDVDGDGRLDVLVPGWGGYALWRGSAPPAARPFGRRAWLPAWLDRGRGERPGVERFEVRLAGGLAAGGPKVALEASAGDLVRSAAHMSVGRLVDENGDGRLDFLLLEAKTLKVWRQSPEGKFPAAPTATRSVRKLLEDRPPWRPYGNLLAADLDGRGGVDFLVQQVLKRELRTRLLVFRGGLAGLDRPDRILVLRGFAATPQVLDANGDGRPDLLVPTFRLDVLSRVKRPAVTEVEVDLRLFLGTPGGRLPPRPDVSRSLRLRTEQLVRAGVEPLFALGDFNADRRADLAVITAADRLQIHLLGRRGGLLGGGRLRFQDRPAFRTAVAPPAALSVADLNGDGLDEILLVYPDRCVLWGLKVRPEGER